MAKKTDNMATVLAACKFYKGEKKNPYNWETQNVQHEFWEYECLFPHKYETGMYTGNAKTAIKKYLNELFTHLDDRYEAEAGTFRKKYETAIAR